ncbi:glycosyltransferase family 4 protein [Mesorhizobium sp. A556]
MKIVQVQTQAEAGGAQRVSDMVGEGLRARGHDVRTVFMYRKTDIYDRDAHADFVLKDRPRGLSGQAMAAFGLIRYLRRARPDAVISYQHYGNIFGTLGARLAGVHHIVANQSGAPQSSGVMGMLSRIDKAMGTVGAYQWNVVNSGWTEAQFAAYPAAYRRRIRRIDHGVASPDRPYAKMAARVRFGLPGDAFIAISTGRLSEQKNHRALVAALGQLPSLHVAIAGAGPEREALLSLAAKQGTTARLHLVGEILPTQIFEFLATGDAYVFPSVNETFGLAAVEAAMAGLPIIANGLPVLREVLTADDGEPAALFVDATAPQNVVAALARVMDEPGLAERLSVTGRGLGDRYSPMTMCVGYENLLLGS